MSVVLERVRRPGDDRAAQPRPRTWTRRPPFGGLIAATAFLLASMTPSLIPRHWAYQALVTGIVTAVGYAFGTAFSHAWRTLHRPEPPARFKRFAWMTISCAGPILIITTALAGMQWQEDLHAIMGMPAPAAWTHGASVLFGLALCSLFVMIARTVRWLARHTGHFLARWAPPRLAGILGGVVVGVLVIGLLDGVVKPAALSVADETFRVSDGLVEDPEVAATSPLRSGSPDSLVTWEDLGSRGREFVADGPSEHELARFSSGPVKTPIRVYVGLASEADTHKRAELVVDELERTGAFDRKILVVMTTTGTGWVNPQSAAAVEYLWGGDTALATMQYSYLPSWLSFAVDSSRARETGAELFNSIYEHWSTLPANHRPKLYVYGESLGADGSEAAFSGIADLRNRVDGALWVGAPRISPLRSSLTERRDPGSPERLPVYDGGVTVRFAATAEDLDRPDGPWYSPHVVYLQHASDPIAWFSPQLMLRRPDWLEEPRAPDVLPSVRWYPFVTFWQIAADMGGAARVPPGYGHDYGGLLDDAWAAVATPPGWSDSDTERLEAVIRSYKAEPSARLQVLRPGSTAP